MNKIILSALLVVGFVGFAHAGWFGEAGQTVSGAEMYYCNASSCNVGSGAFTVWKIFYSTGDGTLFGQIFDSATVANIASFSVLATTSNASIAPWVPVSTSAITGFGGNSSVGGVIDFGLVGWHLHRGFFIYHSGVNLKTSVLYSRQ